MMQRVLHRIEILVFLCLLSSLALSQVVRQPFLQVVTPSSIVLRWDTQTAEVGIVSYGSSVTSLTSSVTESSAKTKHELTITGLSPKQKYFYSIAGPTGGASGQYFVTAPPAGTAQSTRIWVITDFGQSNSTSDDTRRLQTVGFWKAFNNNDLHADLMLSMGDQSEEDTEAQLQANYFNELQEVFKCTPLFTIAGNHEDTDGEVSYKESFSILREWKVIPAGLSATMMKMCGFRNIAVHDYQQITPAIMKSIMTHHLKDFEEFYSAIFEYINKPSALGNSGNG